MTPSNISARRILLYTLLPTAIELLCCFFMAIAIVFVEFARYTGLQPTLSTIFHGDGVNLWSSEVFTGVRTVFLTVGGVIAVAIFIYAIVRFVARKPNDVSLPTGSSVLSGMTQMRQSRLGFTERRWLWRAVFALLIVSFTVFVLPLLYGHLLSGIDFYMASTTYITIHLGLIALVWVVVLHVYVVLVRLFLMRARIFGEFY